MRLPIRTRLTLVSATSTAVVLVATGIFVYLRLQSDLARAVDDGLLSRAQTLLAGIDETGIQFGVEGDAIEGDETFVQIVSAGGDLLESSPALSGRLLVPRSRLARIHEPTYFNLRVATSERTVDARILVAPSDEGMFAIVGVSLEEQHEALAGLMRALVIGGVGALSITTAIGWWVAGAALRPVEKMRLEAEAISADEPGRRLPIPEAADEIARLGTTLNEMLGRLEQALERERRFVDDASHELRTPLGILRAELDLALRRARSAEELEAALRSAAEESVRLTALAEDLLVLARSDRGRLPVRRETVDIAALADEVAAKFTTRAQSKEIRITRQGPAALEVAADPMRLRQMLGNLLDNALRHSPESEVVTIALAREGREVTLAVIDRGPGFSTDFLPRAFDPFTRGDSARTRRDGGAGLGLAIVKAIAEAHRGSATASNLPGGGASVVIRIPAAPTTENRDDEWQVADHR